MFKNLKMSTKSLLRQIFIVGNSGSGKTWTSKLLMQQMLSQGNMNGIAIDTQGDIISMITQGHETEEEIRFSKEVDIEIYTPCSNIARRIHIDPFTINLKGDLDEIEIKSSLIVDLLGFNKSKEARALKTLIGLILNENKIKSFSQLVGAIHRHHETPGLCTKKTREQLSRNAKSIDLGFEKKMFEGGEALDINKLLTPKKGKNKLSIIYMNTIRNQEEKHFFLSLLVLELHRWIQQNSSEEPKTFFFIDECAEFIPPVMKPTAKTALVKLFKQARKYGLCCILATQNPGDIDYKCLSQFSNWFIGRLQLQQDLDKIKKPIQSLSPEAELVLDRISTLKAGEFYVVSPDNFEEPVLYRPIDDLFSTHRVMDEDEIEDLYEILTDDIINEIENEPDETYSYLPIQDAEEDEEDEYILKVKKKTKKVKETKKEKEGPVVPANPFQCFENMSKLEIQMLRYCYFKLAMDHGKIAYMMRPDLLLKQEEILELTKKERPEFKYFKDAREMFSAAHENMLFLRDVAGEILKYHGADIEY